MKNIFKLTLAALVALVGLSSCNDNDKRPDINYTSSAIGFIENPDGVAEFVMVTDKGNVMKVEKTYNKNLKPEDGERGFIYFYIISEEPEESEYDYTVELVNYVAVEVESIGELTMGNVKDVGSDKVWVYGGDVWISGGLLNIWPSYAASNRANIEHKFSLVTHPDANYPDDGDGKYYLEFYHNKMTDLASDVVKNKLISFDLSTLPGIDAATGSVEIIVYIMHQSNSGSNYPREVKLTYKVGEGAGGASLFADGGVVY